MSKRVQVVVRGGTEPDRGGGGQGQHVQQHRRVRDGDAYSLGNDKFTNNTLNEVAYAFWLIEPTNDTLAPNVLMNVNATFYK